MISKPLLEFKVDLEKKKLYSSEGIMWKLNYDFHFHVKLLNKREGKNTKKSAFHFQKGSNIISLLRKLAPERHF